MGDYNINTLNQNEFDKLDLILKTFGLSAVNTKTPTRLCGSTATLIDHFFCENSKDFS